MRAILIDPETREVSEVEIDPTSLDDYYRLIGCDCFTAVTIDDQGTTVYVDDEGLFKGPSVFFLIKGYPQPLAGRGLVVGTDAEGNTIEPSVSIDWVTDNVDVGVPMRAGSTLLFVGDRNVREIQ